MKKILTAHSPPGHYNLGTGCFSFLMLSANDFHKK
ncbi:hypothetical protein FEFB_11160 [Fructobacillus sp. EFB-N1]|nr:hypothetical protein FEFB_11160 [Fructobacillus sp. EFB-N1]